jgi:hypothetical protein
MRVNVGRGIAVAGLCALMALTPAGPSAAQATYSRHATSDSVAPPPPPPPPHHDPYGHPTRQHGVSAGDVALGAGLLIGACMLFCRKHSDGPKKHADDTDDAPDRGDLLENGPHVSDTQPFGAFAVYGFVRDGWPIVIDYDSDPDSATWITVTVGAKSWTYGLESGRHFVNVPYRGGGASQSAPALFTIQSEVRGSRPGQPSRLEIVGLGCGPRAVGSVAIHDLRFAASARQLGGDFARFGYLASSPFNRVGMEILRFDRETRSGVPVITVTDVAHFGQRAVLPGAFGPRMWDGRDAGSGRASRGVHRFQVRGWETDEDESWVSSISTETVDVQ